MKRQLLVPELSEDIFYHQFSSDSYFVHQVEYNYRIKISNELYSLLRSIDGKKNLLQLANEIGGGCDIDFVYNVLYEKLAKYGIVKREDLKVEHKKKPSYLKLSFIVIPPKLISKVTPYLKFLFRQKIMIATIAISVIIILSGIVDNYDSILSLDIENIWLPLLIFGFISVTFHEFGHVTATDYFGAKHGGIGGGFYLFSPVYFADVTDIWKLKPKQRIIVNLAGIYFELIICSIYVILGLIFNINALYLVGLLIFIKTLLNLNPFLRSDGYWVLTDSLGIPNLYKTSSSALKKIIKTLFTKYKAELTLKSGLLALYASVNYILLVMFIYYAIIVDSNSIIYFPFNVWAFIKGLFYGTEQFNLQNISQFAIPILFYYLFFNLVLNWAINQIKKRAKH